MGEGKNEYWATSVDEFIAEGLSNPDFVFALRNLRTDSRNKLLGRFETIFQELFNVLTAMVGVKAVAEDNVYMYLLDGYMAMMASRPTTNVATAVRMDLVNKILQNTKDC